MADTPTYTKFISNLSELYSPQSIVQINSAFEFAKMAHTNQKRLSGEDFITHPLEVALTLSSWKLDTDSIIAGLLHDTIEDGGAKREDLVNMFGEPVALLVDGVTNISKIHLKGSEEDQFVENLRKMLLVMAKDLRVILVKLADRLHNMETLSFLPPQKQREKSRETLDIYAPLAERLGIGKVKGKLEDLSFEHALPEEYIWIKKYSDPFIKSSELNMEKVKRNLLLSLTKNNVTKLTVNARTKHLYSLYMKLLRPEFNRDITKIHDLTALRVIVDNIEDCYSALGVVHKQYRPVPYLGIRDFIANPKPNGYRSIHTNVFGPEGNIIEVQIRTTQMHTEAEMGVAAHWQYSDTKSKGASDQSLEKGLIVSDQKLSWVKQLVSWQSEITDSQEFLNALKFDALQHRNLVFSPKGDVYDLPKGATPIDFAFLVHSDIGNKAIGAKVNGKMVSLNYKLNNGDVVEVLVDKNRKKPSRDWLDFVVTSSARRQLSKSLKD